MCGGLLHLFTWKFSIVISHSQRQIPNSGGRRLRRDLAVLYSSTWHTSRTYRTGCSLESLRGIVEQGEFTTEEARNGHFLHESLSTLFRLIWGGVQAGEATNKKAERQETDAEPAWRCGWQQETPNLPPRRQSHTGAVCDLVKPVCRKLRRHSGRTRAVPAQVEYCYCLPDSCRRARLLCTTSGSSIGRI